jgi:23S rRNA (uracil1939-C5)-methyltransferase
MTAVTIERIAAGGDGVGRLEDGMTVFVPRTAPGDRVELEAVERRRRYARARVRHRSAAGPDRVEPSCGHYVGDACGGCQLQHLDTTAQLEAKRRIVGDALRRIGGLDVPDPEIVVSPSPWRYRSRITLAAARGRIGLHRFDDPGVVFELEDCPITRERVIQLWQRLREHRSLLPRSLVGLMLREDRDGGLHAVVEASDQRAWDAAPLARALGDPEVHVWWRPRGGAARVVAGPQRGFPAVAFEQVYPRFGQLIRKEAVAALGDLSGKVVWDLYAGVGDTGELLAAGGARVWSVDADRKAVEWARAREAQSGVDAPIQRVTGRVEDVLHRLPMPHAAVANPPRGGLARSVSESLEVWAKTQPGALLCYVSCDPATLARDIARMPALSMRSVTAYDLFPQTSHVETLAVLEATA